MQVRSDLSDLILAKVHMLELHESVEAWLDLSQLAHGHVQYLQGMTHALNALEG